MDGTAYRPTGTGSRAADGDWITYRPRRLQLQYQKVSIRTARYIDHCLFYFLQPNFKPISTATQM